MSVGMILDSGKTIFVSEEEILPQCLVLVCFRNSSGCDLLREKTSHPMQTKIDSNTKLDNVPLNKLQNILIVVDTNALMSNLDMVDDLKDWDNAGTILNLRE